MRSILKNISKIVWKFVRIPALCTLIFLFMAIYFDQSKLNMSELSIVLVFGFVFGLFLEFIVPWATKKAEELQDKMLGKM